MNRLIVFDFNRTLYDPDHRALVPDAIELLDAAKERGYTLVLLSKAEPGRQKLAGELGITSYFAETIFAGHKDHALLEGIASRYHADKAASYVIGDRAQGELALGHQGGWRTIWLQAGKFANELPAPDQTPTHTVHALAQILPLI